MKALLTALLLLAYLPHASAEINADTTPPQQTNTPTVSDGEQRIRTGIVILGQICQRMAEVKDHDTAEAAAPKLMKLCEEMKLWSQSFSHLPPLTETDVLVYEERYLGTIRKLNHIIEAQADRLAAAEYYGSRNLPAVLVQLAQIGQS